MLVILTRNMYILGVWSGWANEVKNALNVVAIALRIIAHLLQYEFDGSSSASPAGGSSGDAAAGGQQPPVQHNLILPSGAAATVASRPLTSFGHLVPSFAPNLSSTEGSDAPSDAFSRRLLLSVLLEHAKLCTLLDCAMDFQLFLALRIGGVDRAGLAGAVAAASDAGAAAAGEAAAQADAAQAPSGDGAGAAAAPSDSLVSNVNAELADHFTVVCTLLSYLARSGDVVALLIENEQLKNGRLWQSVSLLLQLQPPPVVMFCIMRLLYSLFASDDPEFVDELWVRDEGRHRAPLKRIANTVIAIVRGALVRKIVTPPIVQEALRVIELLADDSNFKRHVTKNGCAMIFELLSFPHVDVLAAIVPNSTVPKQKLSIANLLRILAGLHCFNAETQDEADKNLFVRTSVMLYRGNAQTLDRTNVIENLKVVPNVFRVDPNRGAYMTPEELDLIMDFAVIFIACVGAGRYHVVDGLICAVPTEELPVPVPAAAAATSPPPLRVSAGPSFVAPSGVPAYSFPAAAAAAPPPQPQSDKLSSADVRACIKWLRKMDTIEPQWDEYGRGRSGAQWRTAVHKMLDQYLSDELDVEEERSLAELVKLHAGNWQEVSTAWRVRHVVSSPYVVRYVFTKISQLRSVLWTSYEDNTLVAILVDMKRGGSHTVGKLNWQLIAQRLHSFTDGHLRTPLSVRDRAIELGVWVERSRGGTGEIVADRLAAVQRSDAATVRRAANAAAMESLAANSTATPLGDSAVASTSTAAAASTTTAAASTTTANGHVDEGGEAGGDDDHEMDERAEDDEEAEAEKEKQEETTAAAAGGGEEQEEQEQEEEEEKGDEEGDEEAQEDEEAKGEENDAGDADAEEGEEDEGGEDEEQEEGGDEQQEEGGDDEEKGEGDDEQGEGGDEEKEDDAGDEQEDAGVTAIEEDEQEEEEQGDEEDEGAREDEEGDEEEDGEGDVDDAPESTGAEAMNED